jgi:endo-1,4-beta-xylanase
VRSVLPVDATETAAQTAGYSAMLQGCLLVQRCLSFTVWGFTDKYQWVPGVFPDEGSAAIWDENFQPKPAYDQMRIDLALAPFGPPRG